MENEYIEWGKIHKTIEKLPMAGLYHPSEFLEMCEDIPAADVVEVRQIRAFIDKLIAERDKYDLHSMRWEHYDCDRLLIEQMLDEMDGGVNDAADT